MCYWMGIFSASLAADFAPGSKAEEKGRANGWGLLYASGCRPRAWHGSGCRGALLNGASLRLSPPTLGLAALALARRRRGTLLHQGFSSPFATDFSRPGPEVQVGGALIEVDFSAPFGDDFGSLWDWPGGRT